MILDTIRHQLKVDAVTVLLLNTHTLTLEYAAARGFTTALQGFTARLGQELWAGGTESSAALDS